MSFAFWLNLVSRLLSIWLSGKSFILTLCVPIFMELWESLNVSCFYQALINIACSSKLNVNNDFAIMHYKWPCWRLHALRSISRCKGHCSDDFCNKLKSSSFIQCWYSWNLLSLFCSYSCSSRIRTKSFLDGDPHYFLSRCILDYVYHDWLGMV